MGLLFIASSLHAQFLDTLWTRSQGKGTLPSWFGSNSERGFAYGNVGGQDRLYVVSRSSGTKVRILDATTGADVDTLKVYPVVTGGTFALNDIEVSDDGVIFGANLTTSAISPFKVYKWTSEAADPVLVLSYAGPTRLGDNFTVTGSLADNSIIIWAAIASKDTVLKFTTADQGANWTATAIKLSAGNAGSAGSVGPWPNVGFFLNGAGQSASSFDNSGTRLAVVPGGVVATGTTTIRYFNMGGTDYFATYQYGGGNENARVVDIGPGYGANATTHVISPALGTAANANGSGDIDFKFNVDGSVTMFVLGANNGVGAYKLYPTAKVTFRLNTAARIDTIRPGSIVNVRGNTLPLTWGDDSPLMTNIGGDYWTITHKFVIGTNLAFKNYATDWDTHPGDLTLTVTKDTVLPWRYWGRGYDDPPYTPSDSIDVWFRVNMGSRPDWDPALATVDVRGGFPGNDWGAGNTLNREGTSKFYSGVVRFSNSYADTLNYKFVFTQGGTNWEDAIGNRKSWISSDTTLVWKTFEDKPIVSILPDTVTVHFVVNTSTVPDTMKSNSTVQIRGGYPPLTWGMDSPVKLNNIGGDYWAGTVKFFVAQGQNIPFKIYTNAKNPDSLIADDEHKGWENDLLADNNNRNLLVGTQKDTALPLMFVNGSPVKQDQYWRPWVDEADSVEVLFRLNMQSNESFVKEGDTRQFIGVRGGAAPLDWGKSILLKKEAQHGNNGSRQYDGTNFWSTVVRFPKASLQSESYYKYVILADSSETANVVAWESMTGTAPDIQPGGDRNRILFANANPVDSTIYWKWWSNFPFRPFVGKDTIVITYRANLAKALSERGFSHGDSILVRSGYGSSASTVTSKLMARQSITTFYQATDTVISEKGKTLFYQYYLVRNGVEYREIFYNFEYQGSDVALAERRTIELPQALTVSVQDTSTSISSTRRQPRFRNQTKLARDVEVTYEVNLKPAIYQVKAGSILTDIQGTVTITHPDSVVAKGVIINGPATGDWGAWGPALVNDTGRVMRDDGLFGDVTAGDTIYSKKIWYTTTAIVGQEFKFGIGGGDNEGGFGNNHIENINDAASAYTLHSQFGSIDPLFYDAWDYTNERPVSGIGNSVDAIPTEFALEQNYPNPFNPSTVIEFALPKDSKVTLKIFNMLGQEVALLVNGTYKAGFHKVRFDASRLTTGVYFYQITADNFVSTKKMLLMK